MFISFLLLAQSVPAHHVQAAPKPVRLSVALAAGAPVRWIGLRLELCGDVSKAPTGRYILTSGEAGVEIDEDIKSSRSEDGTPCYDGFWRRVDGKSFEEAVAGPQSVLMHGISPEYVLSAK